MSRIIIWAGVLPVLLVGLAHAEEPVNFTDGNLKALVEAKLWIDNPTPSEMLGLTSLSADSAGIRSLTGLEYAKNLESLQLTHNEIGGLSALSGLTNLHTLVLNNNKIRGVSALSGLNALRMLDLHDNQISSISALSSLTNLETLILRYNEIGSVSALASLSRLRYAALQHNEIKSISALANLTSLTTLNLRANPLNAEACSTYIPQILANNPGIDLTYDACASHEVEIASTVGGSVIAPGEGTFSFENGDTVLLEAQADPGYRFVNFSGAYFTDQNPVLATIRQSGRIQANFVSIFGQLFVDDDATHDPGPADPDLSDPLEDGTAEHPFDTIQEAIDRASDEMMILVSPGTYCETLDLLDKNLQLVGSDSEPPAYPVIDGSGAGPVVRFAGGQDPNCLLTGFVLTRGAGDMAGAVYCESSSPTIANCLIAGNRATDPNGAAVVCRNSEAVLVNCTIAGNWGGSTGGGLLLIDSRTTLLNNIVWDNHPEAICVTGQSKPLVIYSAVAEGWPGLANRADDPLFIRPGRWQQPDGTGPADLSSDAEAVWIGGDYHLQSRAGRWDPVSGIWIKDLFTSPGIDAGDPDSDVGQEPWPHGHRVNLGAYGATAQASKSP